LIEALSKGSRSVSPSLVSKLVTDDTVNPYTILVQKGNNLKGVGVTLTFTQAGIEIPMKISRLGGDEFYLEFKQAPRYIFALLRCDEPNREMITGQFYEFSLQDFVLIVDDPQHPGNVDVSIRSKKGTTPYLV